jgi:hypothetical protein
MAAKISMVSFSLLQPYAFISYSQTGPHEIDISAFDRLGCEKVMGFQPDSTRLDIGWVSLRPHLPKKVI